jgi:twinkle protein
MSANKTLKRMVQQELGECPPMEHICEEMERLNDGLWIFDLVGTGKISRMMDVFQYAYQRYGITQFVVDSLAKLGMDEDDYAGQKALVDRMGDFVKRNAAHIHLVAHARKGRDENTPPRKMDIKGTGAITDMVDNVYIVHRNKQKWVEYAGAKSEESRDEKEIERILGLYDAFLICDKSREDGAEAERSYGLFFDKQFQQFAEHKDEWREI